jgi:hypothetical protein
VEKALVAVAEGGLDEALQCLIRELDLPAPMQPWSPQLIGPLYPCRPGLNGKLPSDHSARDSEDCASRTATPACDARAKSRPCEALPDQGELSGTVSASCCCSGCAEHTERHTEQLAHEIALLRRRLEQSTEAQQELGLLLVQLSRALHGLPEKLLLKTNRNGPARTKPRWLSGWRR